MSRAASGPGSSRTARPSAGTTPRGCSTRSTTRGRRTGSPKIAWAFCRTPPRALGPARRPRRHGPAWWRRAYLADDPPGGAWRIPLWAASLDDDEVPPALDRARHAAGDDLIDLIVALSGSLTVHHVASLVATAKARADPWERLVLLCAGTGLDGDALDAAKTAIRSALDEARIHAAARPPPWWAPDEAPWLVRGFSAWTPFVARLVAPPLRRLVADGIFAGGYLDGVLDTDHGREPDLDGWATQMLALTPLLDARQVARLDELQGKRPGGVDSGTLRAWVVTGIAVGWAACGEFDGCWRAARGPWRRRTRGRRCCRARRRRESLP